MQFQLEQLDGRWAASGDMTIYHASSLKQLQRVGDGEGDVVLDLENVTELDTCGLQTLLMLSRRAQSEKRALILHAPSAAVREVLGLCGLNSLCGASTRAAI